LTAKNGYFNVNRNNQNKYWLLQTIEENLKHNFYQRDDIKNALTSELKKIEENKTTPFAAAEYILSL
jgi:LAO/AO transport system kinase